MLSLLHLVAKEEANENIALAKKTVIHHIENGLYVLKIRRLRHQVRYVSE